MSFRHDKPAYIHLLTERLLHCNATQAPVKAPRCLSCQLWEREALSNPRIGRLFWPMQRCIQHMLAQSPGIGVAHVVDPALHAGVNFRKADRAGTVCLPTFP